MLGRLVNHLLREVPPEYPWGDTKPLFRNCDWRMCNLECAISDRSTPWARTEKAFHFASDAKNVAVLQAAQIDAVSLANNHVLDFDYEGMFETLAVLDRVGVKHAGAGRDLDAAIKPAISEIKGTKIGVIAFTDNQPEWEAAADHPGIFYLPIDASDERACLLLDTISRVRKNVELLIVSGHWGPNWGYEPLAAHVKFGHLLIDAGADIIFGHSGHVFRGIELYRGRPIIYCAGNFIDDYAVDEVERNDESFIFLVHVKNGRLSGLTLFPTVIAECQARLARARQSREIAFKMASLCAKLGTHAEWHETGRALEIRIGR
jgi:poly-gamma-glutamate capsule biosynthesis protein CapA/YwtB (metallophosphatase superfamily)